VVAGLRRKFWTDREVVPPNLSAVVVYTVVLAVGSARVPAAIRGLLSLLAGSLLRSRSVSQSAGDRVLEIGSFGPN
jgi:hypothetical protein